MSLPPFEIISLEDDSLSEDKLRSKYDYSQKKGKANIRKIAS